jgi:hypothetical protein
MFLENSPSSKHTSIEFKEREHVMNTANRFDMETIARQRQAEIEQYIQQAAQIRNASSLRQLAASSPQWKFGIASFSILSLIALLIIVYLH